MPNDLQDLIQFLLSNNFKAECPNCNGKIVLLETDFFDAEKFILEAKKFLKERKKFNEKYKEDFKERLDNMSQKINVKAIFHQKSLNNNLVKYNAH